MPHIQEVDAKIKEMRQAISALNKHQLSLKETIRKKKDVSKEMDEKVWLLLVHVLKIHCEVTCMTDEIGLLFLFVSKQQLQYHPTH